MIFFYGQMYGCYTNPGSSATSSSPSYYQASHLALIRIIQKIRILYGRINKAKIHSRTLNFALTDIGLHLIPKDFCYVCEAITGSPCLYK